MKSIQLTRGLSAIVDDADCAAISKSKWFATKTTSGYSYAARWEDGRQIYMHRQIAGVHGLVVDHINGNTLDNRRINLRAVSVAENTQNVTRPPRSASGERHIFWFRSGWFVQIVRRGKAHRGGRTFESIEDAVKARDSILARLESENADLRSAAA
jgi:hypothetical protein